MKTIINYIQLAVITLLLLIVMIGCTEKSESPETATAEELSQMNKDFAEALNNKDAAAAALLYSEDASLLPPNEPIVTGRENIKQYWQAFIDAGITNVSVSTISTGSSGDLGYEIGRFQLSFPGEDGKMMKEEGKFTEILKRQDDGKWISIYGMWSSDSAPSE